ncbi:DUF2844 domain-containing protein [Trinickia terrae]|uniref:DUF2844 domain-containing protein n=1 Tax=Trinickia terrae TaxID=2571161 RepID=UPI003F7161B3
MFDTSVARAMLGAALVYTPLAYGSLGQAVSSVANDEVSMHAVSHVSVGQPAYSIHTITLPSGTVVREYVASSGLVFGVAWDGPTLPDLKATLGAAFNRYAAANATRNGNPLAVSADDLVVYSGGHLRAFAGHAYLPAALPAGVDAGVIQ